MYENNYKFYCRHCEVYIFEDCPQGLALRVNRHNMRTHPLDCANWSAEGITMSSNYTGPSSSPEVRDSGTALMSLQGEWGSAKNPPVLTSQDKTLLKEHRIRW